MRIAPIAFALFQSTNVDAFGINNFAQWVPSSSETFRSKQSTVGASYHPGASSWRISRLYSDKTQSLADLEDEVEKRLDSQSADQTLQHSLRAPTKLQQSSQSYSIQEETFKDEDQEAIDRQNTIRRLLDEDDAKWKEERKRKILGKYADAKSQEDIKKLNDEEQRKIDQENAIKAEVAQSAGVTFDFLEKEATEEEQSNFQPSNIKGKGQASSWFSDMDNALSDGSLLNDENADGPRVVNGKLISREETQGVRVGSAGGWTLEVFPGDFVVHRKYGIGRFDRTVIKAKRKLNKEEKDAQALRRNEIVKEMIRDGKNSEEIEAILAKFGSKEDKDPISNPMQAVLEVSYNDAKVHIPVDKAYRLSRYRAGDAVVKPRLSRVKGEAWNKAKRKVEEDTVQMAQDVLALYATRETLTRTPFEPSLEAEGRRFDETFPYEPTPDQQKCFEAVENDMVWRGRPMDRLVCGDVGFGKTEVALRALFRCVQNGRQAALLSPTGVLASQHMKTVMNRMGPESGFNMRIALLRGGMGKNTKAGRALREQIANGDVDLIVGTHALLSTGLKFKDLGLLVVDEEQRFGVKQKERLKLICNGIDVLTLSATPIPRTLQMSLSGIRDTSTIKSPPPMRKPTISTVHEFDKKMIRDALAREFERGGQCYYVVPRIAQLDEAESLMMELFPDVRLIQAHGRMARGGAEENVAEFAEGKYDVLLATTVIENGVDIPSVNTIIINNAQAFGMSTLYQLRGRVGRSNLQGYAYFMHKKDSITEQSAMRLQAMADLHELGSGFDVANRDLEIRGAGSLLGTEQSGMAAKVGFDLYMRMLKKSMRQLRGLDLPMVPRTNILLPGGEGSLEIGVGASNGAFNIPKKLISDEQERYQEEGKARLAESTNQLVEITNSWKNNYGPLPVTLQRKLKTLHLHACTRTLGIDLVGFVENGDGTSDCVLRSPGLRPRHWINISASLSKKLPTKSLDAVFPARFAKSTEDIVMTGGEAISLELFDSKPSGDDEEEWDALDEEEVEAMKEISSAMFVENLDEIEIDEYPRFVVRNMNKAKKGSRVDILLKLLLPASKVVYQKQLADKEKAKVAADLREKRELMKKQKKEQSAMAARRF
mmetsp:Transcript_24990/g.36953  ORF Transcript_24990/g.36953 Transcript_24990/m.36953 type:complete len:1110 (+) Transcript_24990:134-3463(+)